MLVKASQSFKLGKSVSRLEMLRSPPSPHHPVPLPGWALLRRCRWPLAPRRLCVCASLLVPAPWTRLAQRPPPRARARRACPAGQRCAPAAQRSSMWGAHSMRQARALPQPHPTSTRDRCTCGSALPCLAWPAAATCMHSARGVVSAHKAACLHSRAAARVGRGCRRCARCARTCDCK